MAFKSIDKDGSGYLNLDELKEIFGGGRIPDNIWKEIIKEVD
jgi:Ca2+-binding EF-hand superfamily protein